MSGLGYIIIFLFGNIIGSFLNVVIYRLNSGKTLGGRSICMSCAKKLSWYELIPVFSFLIQKGRCRSCASRISEQYPIVEILTGVVFVVLANHFLPILSISSTKFVILLVFFAFMFSILIVVSFYDIKHKIIPNKLSYTFIILSFISMFLNTQGTSLTIFDSPSYTALVAGPLFAIVFALIWGISKGNLMGFGDAKLALGIGWMLGMQLGIAGIVLAFWVGAVFGIFLLLVSKKKVGMKTEIPFAPFLVLGTFIAFILNLGFMDLAQIFAF